MVIIYVTIMLLIMERQWQLQWEGMGPKPHKGSPQWHAPLALEGLPACQVSPMVFGYDEVVNFELQKLILIACHILCELLQRSGSTS